MTSVIPDPVPIEYIHRIIKEKDTWKYGIELVVGPADARWKLVAHGDDLDAVMKDIEVQRAMIIK